MSSEGIESGTVMNSGKVDGLKDLEVSEERDGVASEEWEEEPSEEAESDSVLSVLSLRVSLWASLTAADASANNTHTDTRGRSMVLFVISRGAVSHCICCLIPLPLRVQVSLFSPFLVERCQVRLFFCFDTFEAPVARQPCAGGSGKESGRSGSEDYKGSRGKPKSEDDKKVTSEYAFKKRVATEKKLTEGDKIEQGETGKPAHHASRLYI